MAYQPIYTPQSILGSVSGLGNFNVSVVGMLPAGTQVLGSVATLQGTNPWITRGSVSGTVGASLIGLSPVQVSDGTETLDIYEENQADASVVGVAMMFKSNVSTSIMSVPSPTTPLPVVASISGQAGASIIGQLPAGTAMLGSVAAIQGNAIWNIAGSVLAVQGTWQGSVVAFQSLPSSLLTGASIFGQLPAGTAVLGSVATLQGTNPWLTTFSNSSIITVFSSPSIVGTYAEDAGHTSADKGLFTLAVRNDAIASFVSADLEYTPNAVDSAGRVLTKPFAADETTFTFQTSVVSGSVTLIKASAIGKKSYITDFWLVNSGSVATLITWQDGSTSILGYAVAPAGTGAYSPGIHVPIKTNTSQDLAFKQAPSASILYVTVNGYQAP